MQVTTTTCKLYVLCRSQRGFWEKEEEVKGEIGLAQETSREEMQKLA